MVPPLDLLPPPCSTQSPNSFGRSSFFEGESKLP